MQHDEKLIGDYMKWMSHKKNLPIIRRCDDDYLGNVLFDADSQGFLIFNGYQARCIDHPIQHALNFKSAIPTGSALYIDGLSDLEDELYVEPVMITEEHNVHSNLWVTLCNAHSDFILRPFMPYAKVMLYQLC